MFQQRLRILLPTVRTWGTCLFAVLLLTGLYGLSQHNFLLFHCLTEEFCVIIAVATFFIVWNTRQYLNNGFFLLLALGGLFAGLLKLPFIFGYPGTNIHIFPGDSGNIALQSKLVAQWCLSLSCLCAFFFLRRKVNPAVALLVYGTSLVVILASIFYWRVFPDCFVEGSGATPFDRIGLILGAAAYPISLAMLIGRRHDFDTHLFRVMFAAGTGFFLEDFTTALVSTPDGSMRAIARLAQVAALYFVYKAFMEVGLKRPYDLLFRNLKHSEESLAHSEAELKEAQRVARLGSWELTWPTGYVVWSEELYRMFGRDLRLPAPTLQEHRDIMTPESLDQLKMAVERTAETGCPYELDLQLLHLDGTTGWIGAQGEAVRDATGRIVRLRGTAQDITERKRAEAALREYATVLESKNQALNELYVAAEAAREAKGEFLANMSHEIRTPMTAILGFADILHENCHQPEDHEAVDTIKRNGEYLLQLIDDILDLSKIEAGKLAVESTTCSPAGIVAEVMSLMQVRARAKNVRLEAQCGGPIPESIQTDPIRVRQILINLVGNAIKFTEVGSVRVVTRFLGEGSGPCRMQFDVIDTGIGMSEETAAKLFQPFTQADASTTRRFGGTGLGLAISKRLANLLGGDIAVQSIPQRGSTFTLTVEAGVVAGVRMVTCSATRIITTESTIVAERGATKRLACRLLLAEDGPDNQRLIAFLLRKAGADVSVVENGKAAIECIETAQAEKRAFDLVLMDMQMPIMDGYEATRRLRAEGYTGPIVAVTAHAMEGDREKCLEAGCDDYLSKPISAPVLLEAVAKYTKKEGDGERRAAMGDDTIGMTSTASSYAAR